MGVIQLTGSSKEKQPIGNGELSQGPINTTQSQTLSTAQSGLFVRDARQINNDIVKQASRELQQIGVCYLNFLCSSIYKYHFICFSYLPPANLCN